MKLKTHQCFFICLFALFTNTGFAQTFDARTVFVLSPIVKDEAEAKTQRNQLLNALTRFPLGGDILLFDGYNKTPLCAFSIPDHPRYKHPKARLKHNKSCITALSRFYASSITNNQYMLKHVDIPASLTFIAENLPVDNLDIVIIGTSFYVGRGLDLYNMSLGAIPSDGFINAHPSSSVFGTQGKETALKNARLHMAYTDKAFIRSPQHLHFLTRFWTLYGEALGAKMVSFYDNPETVISRVLSDAKPMAHDFKRDFSAKREMFIIPKQTAETPLHEQTLSTQTLPLSTIQNAPKVKVAVRWDCISCDIDLYVWPWDGAEILFFGKNTTPQGRFLKDFTASPNASNAWETVEFSTPVDISKLRLLVNFYAGHAPQGVSGDIRISVAGHVYASTFSLDATTGNVAADVQSMLKQPSKQSPHTLLLSAFDIVPQTSGRK